MYIEKNGYVIMHKEEMSFLTLDEEFSDDIEEAEVFEEYKFAQEHLVGLEEEFGREYEIVKYHKTIWLDKMGLNKEETKLCFKDSSEPSKCCCESCNQTNQINDIDDFGISMSSLYEAAEQQQVQNEIIEGLTKNHNQENGEDENE